jgi:hypothetical protein
MPEGKSFVKDLPIVLNFTDLFTALIFHSR